MSKSAPKNVCNDKIKWFFLTFLSKDSENIYIADVVHT